MVAFRAGDDAGGTLCCSPLSAFMLLGYNTNGFAHHAPLETLEVLASIGYRSVALTIDQGILNPHDAKLGDQTGRVRRLARKLGLTLVVETGGRYLLDPWQKHEPTLVSSAPDRRQVRVAFYMQAIEIARELQATCVSLWSGVVLDGASRDEAMDRLTEGLRPILEHAAHEGKRIAFEPEPGMLIAKLTDYTELKERLISTGAPIDPLRLTIDIGHLHCQGETPIADHLACHADDLVNVHIEDMRSGVHEHLMFGEGEIDFPPILNQLAKIGYDGPVTVELSRHSHMAPVAAQQAYDFLAPLVTVAEKT